MARVGELIAFFVVTIIVSFALKTLIIAGYFTHVLNHSPGPCRVIKVNGSEDIAILPDGLVFVSSGLRYKVLMTLDPQLDQRPGKLLTFNMNKPDQDPRELTLKQFNRTGFNPHGISMYRDESSGALSVFVVNHRPDAQAIEIFDFERKTHSLVHRRSVVDKLIHSPNNLQAVGPESFYVTNDNFFHFDNTLLRLIFLLFLRDWLHTDIVYFDGSKSMVATGGSHPQNGIATDKHGRFVYAGVGHTVQVYRRQQDQTLTVSQTIHVGSVVDNINVDPATGDLWLAAIPRGLDISAHSTNLSHIAPSQVITIQLGEPSTSGIAFPDYEIREVYMNDGNELVGATTAAVHKGRMLVGSLFSNLLYCELRYY